MSRAGVDDTFQSIEVPVGSVSLRPGASVPKVEETVARRMLGDLVRGTSEPIVVRAVTGGYEVVAGDAAYLAALKRGAKMVKVEVCELDDRDALLFRLREGSRRGELNVVEEAVMLRELNREYGMTQHEIALRCDKTQSTIANKMRLLNLPEEVLNALRRGDIGERHARALLKLAGSGKQSERQLEVFRRVMRTGASAAEVEAMCDLYSGNAGRSRRTRRRGRGAKGVVKDIRIYQNSLRAVATEMKKAGLIISFDEEVTESTWEFKVRVVLAGTEDLTTRNRDNV